HQVEEAERDDDERQRQQREHRLEHRVRDAEDRGADQVGGPAVDPHAVPERVRDPERRGVDRPGDGETRQEAHALKSTSRFTVVRNASGCSTQGKWPQPGIVSTSAPGISAARAADRRLRPRNRGQTIAKRSTRSRPKKSRTASASAMWCAWLAG